MQVLSKTSCAGIVIARSAAGTKFVADISEALSTADAGVRLFTVETVRLETLYVLFFIELGSRRVHLAGCTASPNSAWVTQQARQIVWRLSNEPQSMRFLMHDRDSKFTAGFDHIFVSEGIEIVRTPFRAPKANAVAERWVRTVRQECSDQLLILNQRHLSPGVERIY